MGNFKSSLSVIRAFALLRQDRRAVTAIEYALIAALIAVFIIGALSLLGSNISNTFNSVAGQL